MATSLDKFYEGVITQDNRTRTTTYGQLVDYLQNPVTSCTSENMDRIVDGLGGWVNSSNYKVSLNGLEVLHLLVNRIGEKFRPYIPNVLESTVNRLGDMHDEVRDAAQNLLLSFMHPASSPSFIFERIWPQASIHKQFRVREGVCICLQNILNHYGSKSLQLNKLIPSLVKLLDDSNSQVRDAALIAIGEIYRHVGEKVRQDLMRKNLPANQMTLIMQKFDMIKQSGDMLPTAANTPMTSSLTRKLPDETDFSRPSRTVASAPTVPKTKASKSLSASSNKGRKLKRSRSASLPPPGAGALDEEVFTRSFEQVPKVNILSGRDVEDKLHTAFNVLSSSNTDWEKRVHELKVCRSILLEGGANFDEFYAYMRQMETAFIQAVKDLRSQVVREACITIAFFAQNLGNRLEIFCETIMTALINLIPNSAKVMATSGTTALRFIVQHVHSQRLIPIIAEHTKSKSNIIRRYCYELIECLLGLWPTHNIDKHVSSLQESIKRGVSDADADARTYARKSFWLFSQHFKHQADILYESLDSNRQKQLQGELSNASSSNSINSQNSTNKYGMDRVDNSNFNRGAASRNSARARLAGGPPRSNVMSSGYGYLAPPPTRYGMGRSNSAQDLPMAVSTSSRAKKKFGSQQTMSNSNYGSLHVNKIISRLRTSSSDYGLSDFSDGFRPRSNSHIPLPAARPRKVSATSSYTDHTALTNGTPRSKRTSQSQQSNDSLSLPTSPTTNDAGSRSNSPSTRLFLSSAASNHAAGINTTTSGRSRIKSNIPRSQGASRETSPARYGFSSGRGTTPMRQRTSSQSSNSAASPRYADQTTADILAQKLSGQLNRRYEYNSDEDAGSEVSSLHSESLSQYVGSGRCTDDIGEILRLLVSSQWSERKEGLMSLQYYITHIRSLTPVELKRVTEIFTRMFHDPHAKVFSLFMDTLVEVISIHKHLLHDWLYLLISKMLIKCGGEMLASVAAKTQRALNTIMETFDNVSQFQSLMKFLGDNSQNHNFKVKLQYLNYLFQLMQQMDTSEFTNNSDTRTAVSKIITWVEEPKSAETRNAAKSVIISMFNLNPSEFSSLQQSLQKTFQDTAHKVLSAHMQDLSGIVDSPVSPLSQMGTRIKRHSPALRASPRSRLVSNSSSNAGDSPSANTGSGYASSRTQKLMNADEIFRSIRQTTADIQNLSISSKLDNDTLTKERDSTSQDSGIQSSLPDVRADSPDHSGARRAYKPSKYSSSNGSNGYNGGVANMSLQGAEAAGGLLLDEDSGDDMPMDPSDPLSRILEELSNHEERHEERKRAMDDLIEMTRRANNSARWDEHFKTLLLLLLETLGDQQPVIRAQALQALRELIKFEKHRFDHYAELTILKVIEAHKDPDKEVNRAAEECANMLIKSIKPEHSVVVLAKLMDTLEYPLSVAAIKNLTQVIELMNKEQITSVIHRLIPGLLKGYEHEESSCRKASCFALVALYMKIGDALMPHLSALTSSKLKLLNLYIKRAEGKSL